MAERYENVRFEDQTVELDSCTFVKCELHRCRLIYRGTGPVGLQQTGIVNCQWTFEDAAAETLAFLRGFQSSLSEEDQGAFVSMLFRPETPG